MRHALPTLRLMAKRFKTKAFSAMTADELAEATAEFDREFIADEFGPPDAAARARWARAKRRAGRPIRGRGAKPISVTVELGILKRTDRLAKKLKVSRAQLIERGLRTVLRQYERAVS
jgi:hypothetical protein